MRGYSGTGCAKQTLAPISTSGHVRGHRQSSACQASASAYGTLADASRRRLASSSQWQRFVLSDLLEGYYSGAASSISRSSQHAHGQAAQHQADVQRALRALESMPEHEARSVPLDMLRMLLGFCAEALPEQSLQLLESLCKALEKHDDLLITMQYNPGCRDAINALLNAAADAVRGDAGQFMRWLNVQRALNIYAAEPNVAKAAARVRAAPAGEGVHVPQSIDQSGDWTEPEDMLSA